VTNQAAKGKWESKIKSASVITTAYVSVGVSLFLLSYRPGIMHTCASVQ